MAQGNVPPTSVREAWLEDVKALGLGRYGQLLYHIVEMGIGPAVKSYGDWVFMSIMALYEPKRETNPVWEAWVEDVKDLGLERYGQFLYHIVEMGIGPAVESYGDLVFMGLSEPKPDPERETKID